MHEQTKEAMRHVHTGLVWATAKVSGETMTSFQTHTQVRYSTSAGHRMVTKRIKIEVNHYVIQSAILKRSRIRRIVRRYELVEVSFCSLPFYTAINIAF